MLNFGNSSLLIFTYGYVFSSYVISHSTNGIPTGKERFLRVHDTNGEKRYKCYNFSKRNFDEMMSFIISDKSQIFEEMTNNTPQSHKFTALATE